MSAATQTVQIPSINTAPINAVVHTIDFDAVAQQVVAGALSYGFPLKPGAEKSAMVKHAPSIIAAKAGDAKTLRLTVPQGHRSWSIDAKVAIERALRARQIQLDVVMTSA